ncbi:MAG: oxaloacetate decarboxylase alpha subunit [Candidatus Endobugula sp.]|jgi:oxaloacetate decarboxylase alpha subunit
MGADSLAIKDMAGILTPYDAFELVSQLNASLDIPIALHAHATSGLSSMTLLKAIEAGIDHIGTAISSMSMTYGQSPTESIVAAFKGTERVPQLDLGKLEGALRGVDSRILFAQVPVGMLTNMESQLKEQGASDKFDKVLEEIPCVRKDLGYIPLVIPTSQIVDTQAVINVLTGERYKSISKQTQGILKGEYGAAPAKFNAEPQVKVLDGGKAMSCRPAVLLTAEIEKLSTELNVFSTEKNISLAKNTVEDVFIYALFPQISLQFLENCNNPDAFEPVPTIEERTISSTPHTQDKSSAYVINVNDKHHHAKINSNNDNLTAFKSLSTTSCLWHKFLTMTQVTTMMILSMPRENHSNHHFQAIFFKHWYNLKVASKWHQRRPNFNCSRNNENGN